MEGAAQGQLVRNGDGSRHPGKYEPSISRIWTLGLERWHWVGVELEKCLDSNSQRCRILPSLAALRRRRRRHPRPRTQFHIRIAVQKKIGRRLHCRRRLRIRKLRVHSRSLAMLVVSGWVSRSNTWSLA
jgi:hypothetical protein